jgi:hypothetical protein
MDAEGPISPDARSFRSKRDREKDTTRTGQHEAATKP